MAQAQATQDERIKALKAEAKSIHRFLASHSKRQSAKGSERKSNLTDNESAKMATNKGVIQGYTGAAAVDAKHQIIVAAQAPGSGSEQRLLVPMIEQARPFATAATLITADAGYHSEANLKALSERAIPALIADGLMRRRDARFKDQAKYQARPDPLYNKAPAPKPISRGKFTPQDFTYDPQQNTCICPAGKSLYSNGSHCTIQGRTHHKFTGAQRDCVPCHLRDRCLRTPDKTHTRQSLPP